MLKCILKNQAEKPNKNFADCCGCTQFGRAQCVKKLAKSLW